MRIIKGNVIIETRYQMNNTIFDDVFRTMIEKMPYMAVPLINEVFHTSYPQDVPIVQLRNEHQQENGEIITDSCLKIGGKLYHIECQSVDDTTMAIRMIEYDFSIAVKLEAYTKDSIFEKNLLMLLPFYIMRYEKDIHEMSENPELFQCLLNEYEEIRMNLVIELSGADKTALYMDLNKLIIKTADYICQSEEVVRKGIGEVMGGKVLELESERLRAEGEIRGEAKGEERLSILINRLILDGRSTEIQSVVTNAEIRKQMYKEYGM